MIKSFVIVSFLTIVILASAERHKSANWNYGYIDSSPQVKAEENVKAYILKKFGTEAQYKSYNFGQVFRLKKQEQRELDQLLELKALVPGMKDHYGNKTDSVLKTYDSLILAKENEIKTKNIVSDYIISHVFSIKKKNGSGTVYEIDFILNNAFEVIDLKTKLAADLAKDDFDWFFFFFQRYPIFNSGNNSRDVEESNTIFDYYNNRLAQLKEGKEEFLLTALRVTRIINKLKTYDVNKICGFLVLKKLDEKAICDNYKPIVFSKAEELRIKTQQGTDSLIGYKIFHKYECIDDKGNKEIKAVYSELDAYFTPIGFLPVEAPFDKYFEEK